MKKKEILKRAKKNDYIIKSYNQYKSLCKNFGITQKTLNEYTEELISLFEEEINHKTFICDDEILNNYEFESLIYNDKDFLNDKTTTQLKEILKKEYYEYYNLEYHEQHLFIKENLTENLNISDKEFEDLFKISGYQDSELYFIYNEEQYEYIEEETINENIENLINYIDLNHFNIYFLISNNENRFNHKIDNNININKEYKELRELVKIELYNRIEQTQKEIQNKKEELNKIQRFKEDKEEIKKIDETLNKHKIINNCVFGYEEKLNNDIKQLEEELKELINWKGEKMKPLIRITARHPKTLKVLDLYFYSIKQAKYHNPYLVEFEEKEYIKRWKNDIKHK